MSSPPRLLLIRMDKIGDLVLSLPIDQAPKAQLAEVHWLVSQGTGFIPAASSPPRAFFEFPKSFSMASLWRLVAWIRHLKPAASVTLHAPWWVNLALLLAGVPFRSGRRSQWHSYLFLNFGIRQSRSDGTQHESDLNLKLMQMSLSQHKLFNTAADVDQIQPLKLEQNRIPQLQLPSRFVVIHPGMAGSALNWPEANYEELIRELSKKTSIVVTGTKMDRFILTPLKEKLLNQTNIIWLDEKLSVSELLYTLRKADFVLAPSTGVLHLAASLGTPCLGLYSSIKVQSARRWGPRGEKARFLETPATPSEVKIDPTGAMNQIKVDSVLQQILESLSQQPEVKI